MFNRGTILIHTLLRIALNFTISAVEPAALPASSEVAHLSTSIPFPAFGTL
jgi:hypothetical protein